MGEDNVFESINLAPSMSIPLNGRGPINVPQSLSGTSDDDHDDHVHEEDPSRFFLSVSPKEKSVNTTVHNSQRNSAEYDGNGFFLNLSKLADSLLSSFNQSFLVSSLSDTITLKLERPGDDPIEFLTNRNTVLSRELAHNVAIHERYLANGHSNLDKIRNMILQNFEQLSENYYSLNELYSRDVGATETLFANLEKWDRRRNKVLDKIGSIKSPSNKYGKKLGELLDQSNAVDTEIEEMEKKLESLRMKKQLINVEIESTSSVLESKSAKYVELYKDLETQGKEAITSLLVSNGIPFNEVDDLIQTIPVNVTFMENYNIEKEPKEEVHTPQPPRTSNGMGIQPFIPEEVNQSVIKDDQKEMNYGHGPSAYEKGYEKGVVQSSNFKTHFGNIVHKYLHISSEKPTKPIKVDDDHNTINEKLDLEPVVEMLERRIGAMTDLVMSTSKNSTIFHEYSLAWKDVLGILKAQEEELLEYVSESIPSPDHLDPALAEFLTLTLDQIKSSISSLDRFHRSLNQDFYNDNSMLEVLINETRAVISALTLVSNSEPDYYVAGFKELRVPEKKLNKLMNYEAEDTKNEPEFLYDKHDTYNLRSHRQIKQPSPSRGSSLSSSLSSSRSPSIHRSKENRKASPTYNASFLAREPPKSYSGRILGKALKLTKKD